MRLGPIDDDGNIALQLLRLKRWRDQPVLLGVPVPEE